MKIIIVNEDLHLGGAQTMALELANALNAMPGNEVAFVSAPGVLMGRLEKGIKFCPIAEYRLTRIFKLFFQFKSIFQELKPDIIHPQGATVGVIASIAARIYVPKTRVIITYHSVNFTRLPAWAANALFKICNDAFIAISRAKYNDFIKGGFAKGKVFLIPNFINRERLLSETVSPEAVTLRAEVGVIPGERVMVSAGRLIADKHFDFFIKTLIECVQQEPHIKILGIILGDGPERKRLEQMAAQIPFPNLRIKLLGFKSNVAAYLKTADIFLFPSEFEEVLPMCLIEAISLGVPAVCSDIPGNHDIIEDGFNGFLVNIKERDYAAPVLRILKDPDLAHRLSNNGKDKAEKLYDRDKVVADIFSVYQTLEKS